MAKLPIFKRWRNNEVLTAKDYVYERDAIREEVNDQDDRLIDLEEVDSGNRLDAAETELERLEEDKLDRDGSQPMTGNLNLDNKDIINVKELKATDVDLPNHPTVNTRLTDLLNNKLNRSGTPAMTGNLQMGNHDLLGTKIVSTTDLQVSNNATVSETLSSKNVTVTEDVTIPTHGSVVAKLTQLQDEKVDKNLNPYPTATLGQGLGNLQRLFVDDAGDAKKVTLEQLRAYIAEDFTSFGFVLATGDENGLPDIPISERFDNKIYLVPTADPKGPDDIYNEYLWLNGSWEFIGNTDVDLVNYYTKSQVDGFLNAASISYDETNESYGTGLDDVQSVLERARQLIGNAGDVGGNTFFVSVNGSDDNDGTQNNPFKTIKHACNVISQLPPIQGPFGPSAPLASVRISSGSYLEQLPIVVPPNTALVGNDQRTVQIRPASGLSDDGVTPNNESTMFLMSSGTLAMFIALYGMTGWVKPQGVQDNPENTVVKGVGFALNPASPIFGPSPYILDCSAFFPDGIGAYVDGDVHVVNGNVLGNRSMLFYAYTNINDEGVGLWADNGGVIESVSNFTYYATYGYLATRGGYIRGLNGSNSWGTWALYARGFLPSETPITGEIKGTMIEFRDADGPFQVGTTLTGQTSGATADVLNIQEANQNLFIERTSTEEFIEEETIVASNGTSAILSINEFGQKGALLVLSNLSDLPEIRQSIAIAGDNLTYVVSSVSGTYVDENSIVVVTLAQNKADSSAAGSGVELRKRYSQIRVTGHDFLNVGTGGVASITIGGGTLINPGSPPVQSQQVGEFNTGRVFSVSTDQDGNFRVGKFFAIDQGTGRATLDASAFDLSGLSSLRLGSIGAQLGESINEFSADPLLSQNSNEKVPTQAAVISYVTTELSTGLATKADLVEGKIPVDQLPIEAVVFRGTFGSSESTTGGDLPDGSEGNEIQLGDLYIADTNYFSNEAGISFRAGDKALWDGTSWKKNEGVTEFATEQDAQLATDNTKSMTPLRTKDTIDFRLATTQEAEEGTNTTQLMTPARTKESVLEFAPEVFAQGVVEINNEEELKFWRGTQAEFDALTAEDLLYANEIDSQGSVVVDITPYTFTGIKNNFKIVYAQANPSQIALDNGVYGPGWSQDATAPAGSVSATDGTRGIYIVDNGGNSIEIFGTGTGFDLWNIFYSSIPDPNTHHIITDEVLEFATQAQAEAGTDEETLMNPLRTKEAIEALSPAPIILEATLSTSGWTGTDPTVKVQTVTGILPTDNPIIDIKLDNEPFNTWEDIEAAWSLIKAADTGTDQITFYALGVPDVSIPIRIKIVR